MRFSIVTPSYNSSQWLKLCIASVADQGVDVEHIVQDSCSTDGTQEWLPNETRVQAFIEKDCGMYDAINRGLRRCTGDILAYLNCDEQFLPDALSSVLKFFEANPRIDVLFGNVIIADGKGEYICSRTVNVPNSDFIRVAGLPVFSCATFFRRRLLDENFYFDPSWRAAGDADWVLRLLEHRVPMAVLPQFTSVFTDAGHNLGLSTVAQQEAKRLFLAAPKWVQSFRFIPVIQHRLTRLLSGAYRRIRPFEYEIYTLNQPAKRHVIEVEKPTFLWKTHFDLAKDIGT